MRPSTGVVKRRSNILTLAVLLALALAVRLSFLAVYGGLDGKLHDSLEDQHIYLDLARNIAAGHGMVASTDVWVASAGKATSIVPPLYPLVLAGILRASGDDLLMTRLVQVLLSATVAPLIFLIALRVASRTTALVAAAMACAYPGLVMYCRPFMSESLFFPGMLGLLFLTYRVMDHRATRRWPIIWAVAAGLLVLTRAESIFLVGALAVYLALAKQDGARMKPARVALVVGVFALTQLPFGFYNYTAHGVVSVFPNKRWILWDKSWLADRRDRHLLEPGEAPERKIVENWAGHSEIERDKLLERLALEFAVDHPAVVARQRLKSAFWAYPLLPRELVVIGRRPDGWEYGPTSLDDVVTYATAAERLRVWCFRIVFALAIPGLVLFWRRTGSWAAPIIVALGWNLFHTTVFVGSERLRLQIDGLLIILAAISLEHLYKQRLAGGVSAPPRILHQVDHPAA